MSANEREGHKMQVIVWGMELQRPTIHLEEAGIFPNRGSGNRAKVCNLALSYLRFQDLGFTRKVFHTIAKVTKTENAAAPDCLDGSQTSATLAGVVVGARAATEFRRVTTSSSTSFSTLFTSLSLLSLSS